MGMNLTPESGIYSGSNIAINISKSSDVQEYAVTQTGIPPVIAKYIAYDNLAPANPFIATVEDGLGNILLDGGFPKWYNNYVDAGWTTYASLSPTYKYLYDAIDFISNNVKVAAGNKKILILGDQNIGNFYCIKEPDPASYGFKLSIDKVCAIKGYTPTYKTLSDYGSQIDCQYSEMDQYCGILFFSTNYTNAKLITDGCIQALISYRENGNGIFIITDHGDRNLTSINEAINTDNAGFYRTANYIVANFGCYFSGNYNRVPVNVGFLRANYGNHILWNNLANSDEIYAGGSESKCVITEYPLHTGSMVLNIANDGYIPVKFLMKMTDGSIQTSTYTYGKNVPEALFFLDKTNTKIDVSTKQTYSKTHLANLKVEFAENVSGVMKINSTPVGTFNFNKSTGVLTKAFYSGYSENLPIGDNDIFYIQMTSPLVYTKGLTIDFIKPTFNLRVNKGLKEINKFEFKIDTSTSQFRNLNKLVCDKSVASGHFSNSFKYKKIIEYFI